MAHRPSGSSRSAPVNVYVPSVWVSAALTRSAEISGMPSIRYDATMKLSIPAKNSTLTSTADAVSMSAALKR